MNFLIPSLLLSFILSLVLCNAWINRAKKAKLIAPDVHKKNKYAAELGGLPVLTSFLISILLYLGIRTFYYKTTEFNLELLAIITSILIAGLIGLVDDILGWKLGLKQWQKPLLTIIAALPIMMINAGSEIITLPFLGQITLGLLYPLIVIPIIIVISSNAFNMIAGYNGLEGGLGVLILGTLGLISWRLEGLGVFAMPGAVMMFALIAFLIYNLNPASVFPGDILTYSVGALIGIVAIMGNTEKALFFLLIPYYIQFLLKLRGKFKKESFAKIKNNRLFQPYKKIYAIEHLILKLYKKPTENKVVYSLWFLQAIICIGVLLSF